MKLKIRVTRRIIDGQPALNYPPSRLPSYEFEDLDRNVFWHMSRTFLQHQHENTGWHWWVRARQIIAEACRQPDDDGRGMI